MSRKPSQEHPSRDVPAAAGEMCEANSYLSAITSGQGFAVPSKMSTGLSRQSTIRSSRPKA